MERRSNDVTRPHEPHFGRHSARKVRTGGVLVVAILLVAIGTSAAGAAKPKPLSKPVCNVGQPAVSSSQVHLVGSCRIGKKTVLSSIHWTLTGESDASGAPLPVQPSSGVGNVVPIPIAGGYKLALSVKLSTPKTKTHRAAGKLASETALLGGYTAIGTQQPILTVWPNAIYPYMGWDLNAVLGISGNPLTVMLPTHYLYPDLMGTCKWQSVPPESPTDVIPGMDGTVTSTGLTVYGGKVVCTDTSGNPTGYWAIPELVLGFGTSADSCELVVTGVTSFAIPPEWGRLSIAYAHLLTFNSAGELMPDSPSRAQTWTAYSGPQGNIDPCQTYHLPAWKAGRP